MNERDNSGTMADAPAPEGTPPTQAEPPASAPAAPAPPPAAPAVADEVAKLQQKLAEREKELIERLARLQADFDNFRRRAREEAAQASARGKLDLVKMLIPVLDNLDRALAHHQDEGLKLLQRQLQSTLADAGLSILAPEGEAFDAKAHEAIAQEAREGVKSGTVLSVVEKGYALDGRLVRPARVIVAT